MDTIVDGIVFGIDQKARLVIINTDSIHKVGTFFPRKLLRFLRQLLIGLIHPRHSFFWSRF